jgi:prepilin-type N-terminal cleavage/methylation domain-containing protein
LSIVARRTGRRARDGFTLVEVLVAMTVGVLLLMLTMQIVQTILRTSSSTDQRVEVDRAARLIGVALQRDLQEAGVDVTSSANFGSVYVRGDTIVLLRIPYKHSTAGDTAAYMYNVIVRGERPDPGNGTACGTFCLDLDLTNPDSLIGTPLPMQVTVGGTALLFANGQYRLLLPTAIATSGRTAQLTFANQTSVLGHPTGLRAPPQNVQLAATGNFVENVVATTYYRSGTTLLRATTYTNTGAPVGEVMADSVTAWSVKVLFVDGDSASTANTTDGDTTNDWNDVSGVRITATIAPNAPDRRTGQVPPPRTYQWTVSPRNLTYERNRLN